MTLEANLTDMKIMRIHYKSALLAIPIRFTRILGWEPFIHLFLTLDNDILTLTDEKTFTKTKLKRNMKVYKIKLTGSNNVKGLFNFRIIIPNEVVNTMKLEDHTHFELTLEKNDRIVIKRIAM